MLKTIQKCYQVKFMNGPFPLLLIDSNLEEEMFYNIHKWLFKKKKAIHVGEPFQENTNTCFFLNIFLTKKKVNNTKWYKCKEERKFAEMLELAILSLEEITPLYKTFI